MVREQLHKIVASRTFRQSKRLVRFLSFIVERALLGQGDQIHEYLVGVEVYERPASFDPHIDTIVRTEARRLRSKLHDYYDAEGRDDLLLVDVPKGAYAPRFLKRTPGISDRQAGQLISRYRVLRKIREGGMGDIYLAEDTVLGRPVALKFIPGNLLKDSERRSRLFREARAAALIDHPNVCTVHEIDEVDGHPFLVRAYVEGQNLEERIVDGALRLVDALTIACQVADGLQAAHQQGVVHRDLKPANIIISAGDTEGARVRIIDGLAQLSESSTLAEPGTPIGTASYISPEQMNGKAADHRSDIWSLGVILYEMLTGERPFRGKHREAVFYAIAHQAPEPMNRLHDGISAELERIVSKCLEKDPSRRYPNAASLRADLVRLRGVTPISIDSSSEASNAGTSIPGLSQPGFFSWNRRWMLGVAAVLILAVVSLLWFSGRQSRGEQGTSIASRIPRLAVLPFESRTPGEENQALSYAISDSLITRLAKLSSVQVTSWTSALRLTERKATLAEIAKLLKVDYILEGSFLKTGDGFHVTVQCIRTADDSHVWAEEFVAPWKDIFAMQKQVSEEVVRQVNAQLNSRDRRVLAHAPRETRAYQVFAQGHYNLLRYDSLFQPKYLQDAESLLKEAVQIDPDYSDALADLGRLYYMRLYPPRDDRREMVAEGTTYLERALDLDPENVEAHCWLAGIYSFVGLTEKALELSRKAVELGPNNPEAHRSLAERYRERGFLEAVVAENNRAGLTDSDLFAVKPWHLLELGDFDGALQTVKQMETVEPTSPFIGWVLGEMAFMRGDFSQAESEWRRILQTNVKSVEIALGLLATRRGQLDEGKRVLEKFRDRPGFGGNHLMRLAAAVGDVDFAIRSVRTSQYYGNYRWLVADPDMATLRNHAAFRELVNELYTKWQRDVAEVGPSLPARPPKLPTPQTYLTQRHN